MKSSLFIKQTMLGMTIVLSFSACNGILGDIYDNPDDLEIKEFGFIEVDKANNSGTIYIDTRDYGRWTYIDFHAQEIDSLDITDNMQEPQAWDIAVHRYDTKTNGATVIETGYSGLAALKSSGKIPEGTYVADVWEEEKIVQDATGMFEGNMKYAPSYYNAELSKWLFVDTSSMPPTFTPSDKVYVIKLKDDTYAAVRLKNFKNVAGTSAFMTIDYIYPLEF